MPNNHHENHPNLAVQDLSTKGKKTRNINANQIHISDQFSLQIGVRVEVSPASPMVKASDFDNPGNQQVYLSI
jgi:hypothetical protein